MAGEYSRELSEKVFAGMSLVARDGFRTGGQPGYGYRRMLISADGTPKGEIPCGERKSMSNERVILIPGPATEIHWVREIYRMFISENRSIQGIVDKLNGFKVPYLDGRKWQDASVRGILRNPKYEGMALYNRTSGKLTSPQKMNAEKEWRGAGRGCVGLQCFPRQSTCFHREIDGHSPTKCRRRQQKLHVIEK